ncbi:MAG: sugar phosphate isomerase/epimerase family protein [Brevinematia bacterium]
MFKIGLKLWSINENYIKEALKLYEDGTYDYIELYVVPNSYETYARLWKELKIPFVIHAPHFGHNLNFSIREAFDRNKRLVFETLKFADLLDVERVIFHPGVNGELKETISQIKRLYDPRMIIENKPYLGNGENLYSLGSTPDEIKKIMDKTGVEFCFDFGHAVCSANAHKKEVFSFIEDFLSLKPLMYHLTDGDFKGVYDSHLHYGEGTFPLKKFVEFIPDNSFVTNEAVKNHNDSLLDFKKDIDFIKSLLS